jgi:hypothetical protein
MSKKEAPINQLQHYLPPNTFEAVYEYLHTFKVHLTVARERKSILGDYRHRTHSHNHRISVNGNLNKYSFLITLLHELAHLLTFEKYGNKVQSHGREWKTLFGRCSRTGGSGRPSSVNCLPSLLNTMCSLQISKKPCSSRCTIPPPPVAPTRCCSRR